MELKPLLACMFRPCGKERARASRKKSRPRAQLLEKASGCGCAQNEDECPPAVLALHTKQRAPRDITSPPPPLSLSLCHCAPRYSERVRFFRVSAAWPHSFSLLLGLAGVKSLWSGV